MPIITETVSKTKAFLGRILRKRLWRVGGIRIREEMEKWADWDWAAAEITKMA